jgi:hypothetical protein
MQNENTMIENPEPTPSRRSFRRPSRKACLRSFGITLLVAGVLGAIALNHLMPTWPDRTQGVTDRMAWYVQHGQLKADLHTFASAVEYLATSESELPVADITTNPPVAGKVVHTAPKS